MNRLILCLALVVCAHATAAAQSLSGKVVPIEPCVVVYGVPLIANVPLNVEIRGYCVPNEATAVYLNMKAGGSLTSGKVYAWPYNGSFPVVSQFNYDPNVTAGAPHSGQALVRLRLSGGYKDDVTFQSTTNVNFSAIVEGYILP